MFTTQTQNDVMLPCLPLIGIYLHSPGQQVSMYPLATCQTLWNKQHKRISIADTKQDAELVDGCVFDF